MSYEYYLDRLADTSVDMLKKLEKVSLVKGWGESL